MDPLAHFHAPATGGGSSQRLVVAIGVPDRIASRLTELARARAWTRAGEHVIELGTRSLVVANLGAVVGDYVPAVLALFEDVARSMPDAIGCRVTGTTPTAMGSVLAAEVDLDGLARVGAARAALLRSIAPYAPEADSGEWHPHLALLHADATAGPFGINTRCLTDTDDLSWTCRELQLVAMVDGPFGREHRVQHSVALGDAVAATRAR